MTHSQGLWEVPLAAPGLRHHAGEQPSSDRGSMRVWGSWAPHTRPSCWGAGNADSGPQAEGAAGGPPAVGTHGAHGACHVLARRGRLGARLSPCGLGWGQRSLSLNMSRGFLCPGKTASHLFPGCGGALCSRPPLGARGRSGQWTRCMPAACTQVLSTPVSACALSAALPACLGCLGQDL